MKRNLFSQKNIRMEKNYRKMEETKSKCLCVYFFYIKYAENKKLQCPTEEFFLQLLL